jgi:hypothetical protein
MANFTAGTSFSDGVTNDVTAAKLNALVADAVPTSNLALTSTNGTISNFTSSTATITGAITGSTNVINIGSGQIYKDASGNVGINNTSPSGKIDIVTGSTGQQIYFRREQNSNQNLQIYHDINGGHLAMGGTVAKEFNIENLNSASINVSTNGTERLRIDSSGNVGIGTSPSDILHVSKANGVSIFESTGVSSVGIRLRTNSTDRWQIGCPNASADLAIYTGTAAVERLRIDSSGNCSIGTATALSKLHVHGDLTLSNATTAVTASTSTITPPATVAGYLTVSINGTSRKIPYYAT